MRDHFLFAVVPYLGGLAFVAGCVVQVFRGSQWQQDRAPATGRGGVGIGWRLAFAAVAIGHVLTLGFPAAVLRWDTQFLRLFLLEGLRLTAGCLAVAGTIAALVRLLRRAPDGTRATVDVVAATLLLIGMTSGVALAIVYRWASSWAEVTLVPYLYSLARFDPNPELVTHLPMLVKLHVASAFGLIAILPFTALARAIVAPVDRFTRKAASPALGAARAAWLSVQPRMGAAVHSASALVFHNGEEEN